MLSPYNLQQFSILTGTLQHLKIGHYSLCHEVVTERVEFSSVKNGEVSHELAKSSTLSENVSACLHLTKLMFNMALRYKKFMLTLTNFISRKKMF